jgi:hypothetical protein
MKKTYNVSLAVALCVSVALVVSSCNENTSLKSNTVELDSILENPVCSKNSDSLSLEEADIYVPGLEKHFDCSVNEIVDIRKKSQYAYITECGIMFYSDIRYVVGDTLKGFPSQKHK